jgi:hypothetical protein
LTFNAVASYIFSMKRNYPKYSDSEYPPIGGNAGRENNWCAKYGYFIDLDACQARSLNRAVCRRCYKSLLQLSLPFGDS